MVNKKGGCPLHYVLSNDNDIKSTKMTRSGNQLYCMTLKSNNNEVSIPSDGETSTSTTQQSSMLTDSALRA